MSLKWQDMGEGDSINECFLEYLERKCSQVEIDENTKEVSCWDVSALYTASKPHSNTFTGRVCNSSFASKSHSNRRQPPTLHSHP